MVDAFASLTKVLARGEGCFMAPRSPKIECDQRQEERQRIQGVRSGGHATDAVISFLLPYLSVREPQAPTGTVRFAAT